MEENRQPEEIKDTEETTSADVALDIQKEEIEEDVKVDTSVDKGTEYTEDEIQVLKGLEAVRKRPGMYIGTTSIHGLHHLVYEIVDNSIDEALAGFCDTICVTINPDNSITVIDNGRGIPAGMHPKEGIPTPEVVYTILHAGGKFGGGGYKIAGGLHGVGASVVNALSEWLELDDCYEGKRYTERFERGNVARAFKCEGEDSERSHGVKVTFKPDHTIFEETVFDYNTLLTRMREQAFLSAGVCIILRDDRPQYDLEGNLLPAKEETLKYEGGIKSFVEYINNQKKCNVVHQDVIYMSGKKDDMIAEVALQYNDTYNETLVTFANNMATIEGGTHEVGFKTALTKVMNGYGRKAKILKQDDKDLTGEDVREGLTAIVSVKLPDAQFESQTKAKLGNSEIRSLVYSLVTDKLAEYLEENPNAGRAIMEKALAASRAREAARKARESVRRKTGLESGQMPEKLQDCNERDPSLCELYVVEGDSAGGSAIQGRDSRFQAILSMWGKMLNVEKARADKIYGNDKLYPLIVALGCGIGEEFKLEKLRYHKVIIMADADVDGAHIRTLLLTFFFRYMKPMIENGYVYSAVPPLYKLTRGRNVRVAYSDEERDRISQEMRENNPNVKIDISRFKGLGEMNPTELWETTMDPERRTLRRITMEDAIRADGIFNVLMGEEVEPRKEWIEKNAKYAINVDI